MDVVPRAARLGSTQNLGEMSGVQRPQQRYAALISCGAALSGRATIR